MTPPTRREGFEGRNWCSNCHLWGVRQRRCALVPPRPSSPDRRPADAGRRPPLSARGRARGGRAGRRPRPHRRRHPPRRPRGAGRLDAWPFAPAAPDTDQALEPLRPSPPSRPLLWRPQAAQFLGQVRDQLSATPAGTSWSRLRAGRGPRSGIARSCCKGSRGGLGGCHRHPSPTSCRTESGWGNWRHFVTLSPADTEPSEGCAVSPEQWRTAVALELSWPAWTSSSVKQT